MAIIDPKKQKLIIEIEEGQENLLQEEEDNTGMPPTWRPPFYVRRFKKPGDIVINFYDLGQFTLNGGLTWNEFTFSVAKATNWLAGITDNITLADYQNLWALILDTPKESWKSKFRKFSYDDGYKYGVDIYLGGELFDINSYFPVGKNGERYNIREDISFILIENSTWDATGLRVNDKQTAQAFSLHSLIGFHSFALGSNSKATKLYDYNAPTEQVIIDKATDIFLLPAFTLERGLYGYNGGLDSYSLNNLYVLASRKIWIDGLPSGVIGIGGVNSPFMVVFSSGNFDPFDLTDELITIAKTRPLARAFNSATGLEINPELFPLEGNVFFEHLGFISPDDLFTIPVGALIAVIKVGGDWFYVWNTEARPNKSYPYAFSAPRMRIFLNP